jgi:hypothetical protein
MIERWTNADDRLLARSVFGTDNSEAVDELILARTAEQGLGGACVSSIELSIGAAVIVTLSDGSKYS